jgi:hypothetical protein
MHTAHVAGHRIGPGRGEQVLLPRQRVGQSACDLRDSISHRSIDPTVTCS